MGLKHKEIKIITIEDILDYEIRSSWWASRIFWGWGHSLSAKYYAWKVNLKWKRYVKSKRWHSKLSKKD